jgi:ribosomal protein L7/L12
MSMESFAVIVLSIGRASPAVCQRIAPVLALPAAAIARLLYQAPAVLLGQISRQQGREICHALEEAGLAVELVAEPLAAMTPPALFDVAVHIGEPADFADVAARLAEFLGCPPADAERLLETPPGVVLGDVSAASVEALMQRLAGLGACVVRAERKSSVYDLFVASGDSSVGAALRREFAAVPAVCDARGGLILRGLSHEAAAAVWRRHQASGAVRLVNQAFEQWDITLVACDGSVEKLEALSNATGIPREICAELIAHLPVVIEDGVGNAAIAEKLLLYSDAGLEVRAILTTFRVLQLTVVRGCSVSFLLDLFRSNNIDSSKSRGQSLPFTWPKALNDLQAKRLKQQLEANGCEVELGEL